MSRLVTTLMLTLLILSVFLTPSALAEEVVTLSLKATDMNGLVAVKLPKPLEGYQLAVKMRTITTAEVSLRYKADREQINPGEDLTLTLTLQAGRVTLENTLILELYDPEGRKIAEKAIFLIPIPVEVPGEYLTPVNLMSRAYLKADEASVEAVVLLQLSASVYPWIRLEGEKLIPQEHRLEFSKAETPPITFTQSGGLGAAVAISHFGLNSKLTAALDLELEVDGDAIYTRSFESKTFQIAGQGEAVEKQILILQTPIKIEVEKLPENSFIDEGLTVKGRVTPAEAGIPLKILSKYLYMQKEKQEEWQELTSITTNERGIFQYHVKPLKVGAIAFLVIHEGSPYTTKAKSEFISSLVLRKQPLKLEQTLIPLIAIAILLAIFARWEDVKSWVKRRPQPPHPKGQKPKNHK